MHYAADVVTACAARHIFLCLAPECGAFVFHNSFFFFSFCFDFMQANALAEENITLICTPMGWNWRERSSLTKENICIK